MFTPQLIVLSYHDFTNLPDEYQFSRTYEQFEQDLAKIRYDWITIDDARESIVRACEILRRRNIRAKLFVSTSLVDCVGYCSWKDIKKLSAHHDIENHSHLHKKHTEFAEAIASDSIELASQKIEAVTGRRPSFFVPPYNTFNSRVERIANIFGLQLVKNRITILNDTEIINERELNNVMVGSGGKINYKF
jgi:peptidoglycan/xylan/chitin deacetylase (PgdA/CDA1 family)